MVLRIRTESQASSFIRELGGDVISVRRGKHWVVQASFEGYVINLALPVTGSDYRWVENKRAEVKKRIAEAREREDEHR